MLLLNAPASSARANGNMRPVPNEGPLTELRRGSRSVFRDLLREVASVPVCRCQGYADPPCEVRVLQRHVYYSGKKQAHRLKKNPNPQDAQREKEGYSSRGARDFLLFGIGMPMEKGMFARTVQGTFRTFM